MSYGSENICIIRGEEFGANSALRGTGHHDFYAYDIYNNEVTAVWTKAPGPYAAECEAFQSRLDRGDFVRVEVYRRARSDRGEGATHFTMHARGKNRQGKRLMHVDDLKVTILRAARPGDVVFFQVATDMDPSMHRQLEELVIAAAKLLREKGLVPVMLPASIQPVVAEPVPAVLKESVIDLAGQLIPMELAALIEWHENTRGLALLADDLDRAAWHRRRLEALRNLQRPRPACGSTAATSSQTADTPDRAATQSTAARGTGPSEN